MSPPEPVERRAPSEWPSRASRKTARRTAAAVGVVGVVLGILWLAVPSTPSSGSDKVRVQLVALLAAPPGTILPDTADLLARVAALRGQSERPLLRELLAQGPPQVRLNTVRLLALMKDPAVEPVIQALSADADELSRLVALDLAGRSSGKPPLAELQFALSSSRADVRCYAIEALEAIGSATAVLLLEELTRHSDATTRVMALRAVLALDPSALVEPGDLFPAPPTEVVSPTTSRRAKERRRTGDRRSNPRLRSGIAAVSKESPGASPSRLDDRDLAVEARRRPPVAKDVEAAVSEVVPEATTVGRPEPKPKSSPPPKPAPVPKPPSPIEVVKRDVPRLLEQKMHATAIERITDVMEETDTEDAELYRLRGLAHLGAASYDDATRDLHRAVDLAPDLNRAYFDLSVSYAAKRQRRNAYGALIMALRFGFRDILAIRGEERLDIIKSAPAFHTLMEHYFHSPLAAELDDEKRLRYSTRRLRSELQRHKGDAFLRALAVFQFPEAGGLEATELLYRLLKDRDVIVRRALAEMLSRTRDPESIAYLRDRVGDARATTAQREAVIWALHRARGANPVDALLKGLDDESLAVRLAAAQAVGDRPDRRAVAPLIELLERVKPLDQLTVAEALGKITGRDLGLVAKDWSNWWEAHRDRAEIGPVRNPCSGSGAGTVFIPPSFSNRYGKSKVRALAQYGGTRSTEAAVEAALAWLARHQSADGRWDTDEWALQCDERKAWERVTRVRRRSWDTQVTGVALMAFLGAGYTHLGGEYHQTVRRGLEYLRKRQRSDGYFSGDHNHWHRSHEIATIAMSEAYLMTRDCELKDPVERAIGFILGTQHLNGGWGWHAHESYTSLTGWNLLAMVTAADAGIRVPASAIVSARHFLDQVTLTENGPQQKAGFAFETLRPAAEVGESLSVEEHEDVRGGGSALSTTVALCCRMLLGQNASDSRVNGALAQLRRSPPRRDAEGNLAVDERLFFGTQSALWQGGALWREWNRALKGALLESVVREGCERGSWAPSGDYGRVYSTALAAVILESYYRFGIARRS